MNESHNLRPTAALAYPNLVSRCKTVPSFKKWACCDITRMKYEDASFRELKNRFAALHLSGRGTIGTGTGEIFEINDKFDAETAIKRALHERRCFCTLR